MRNRQTLNEIIDKGTHYEMVLYSVKYQEKARTLFSKQHLKKVKQHKWCLMNNGYCITTIGKIVSLHHFILGKPSKGYVTDHKNRNKLDNRDNNIHFVTHSQNTINREIQKNNTSGVKGVHWNKLEKKWSARIKIKGKWKYLGYFKDIKKAAIARKTGELKYYQF